MPLIQDSCTPRSRMLESSHCKQDGFKGLPMCRLSQSHRAPYTNSDGTQIQTPILWYPQPHALMPAEHGAGKAGGRVRTSPRLILGVGASSESEALGMLAQPCAPLAPHTTGEMHIPVAANITHTWDFSTEVPSGLAYRFVMPRDQGTKTGTSGNN